MGVPSARLASIALPLAVGIGFVPPAGAQTDAPQRAHRPLQVTSTDRAPTAARSIERARSLLDRAQFEAAIQTLDGLEQSDSGLSRELLLELYAVRSAAHLALGRSTEVGRDLARLAALAPDYRFPPQARPELQEGLAARRGPALALELRVERESGAARIASRVIGDPGGLARQVRVRARTAGHGAWIERSDGEVIVPGADEEIEYWGELVGPGGAILATAGSAEHPLRDSPPVVASAAGSEPSETSEPRGGGMDLGAVLGIVGAAIAAGAVIAVVAAVASGQTSNDSQPGVPSVVALSFDL